MKQFKTSTQYRKDLKRYKNKPAKLEGRSMQMFMSPKTGK